jgi:hypothetical protein
MSAFLCSSKHISALVHAARGSIYLRIEKYVVPVGDEGEEQALYDLLLGENLKSLEARYGPAQGNDGVEPNLSDEVLPLQPIEIIKLAQSFDYQSCEHPEWTGSRAHDYIMALIADCIGRIDGYEKAKWSI